MRTRSEVDNAFKTAGFKLLRRTNHPIWGCPCGHAQIAAPGTPGRGRSVANSLAQMARTLRACEALKQQRSTAA